jgi:hypothetical protein
MDGDRAVFLRRRIAGTGNPHQRTIGRVGEGVGGSNAQTAARGRQREFDPLPPRIAKVLE